VEIRDYMMANSLPENIMQKWKGAKTGLKVVRKRDIKGKVSEETIYVISSLDLSYVTMEKLASYLRNHWLIENSLH